MERAAAPSDSSDDPPVVPLNLPADGTTPAHTGPAAAPVCLPQEVTDRPGTPAGETGPPQSRYSTP
eukprot:15060324-Alexandrium_andersonii.AAC.1